MDLSDYKWYQVISSSGEITQGDILPSCPVPSPKENVYRAIIQEKEQEGENLDIVVIDAIILTQACDIANDKVNSIVLCPIWPLKILCECNDYYKKTEGKKSLRQGKEPAYHLLNSYKDESFDFPLTVVEFHHIYSLPKEFLQQIALNLKTRLRLLPPYREHLSQAFARYFMRVGLPVDIPEEELRRT
jgi:hypothetical protein